MESRFHRVAIITGSVDSFCLVCDEHLKRERDADAHATKPLHRKNLLAMHYMDKFGDDHIRKVKKGYFCWFCNLLLPTAAKVGLHVAEPLHLDNKASKLLKRVGTSVIAFENVSISERAWNGLMEDTCVLCNVEYDDEDVHKKLPNHILHLIQCKVQYGANNSIYRVVDINTFQCLTCNVVLSWEMVNKHFDDSDHEKLYSECLVSHYIEKPNGPATNIKKEKHHDLSNPNISSDSRNNLNNFQVIPNPEIIVHKNESAQIEITIDKNTSKILDLVNGIQKNEINIDFETESVFCKKCLMTLDFNYDLIEKHMREHVHKPKTTALSGLSYPPVDQNHNKISLTLSNEPRSDHNTNVDNESITNNHNVRALTGLNEVKPEYGNNTDDGKYKDYNSSPASLSEREMVPSSKTTEDPSVSDDANSFAKRNQLAYSENCRTAYCRVCDAKLPATLTSMKEHVAGTAHKIRIDKFSKPKPGTRKTNNIIKQSKATDEFVEELLQCKIDSTLVSFIINRKYLVDVISFTLVTMHGYRFRCQVCEVNLKEDDCVVHINSMGHNNKLEKIPVITSLESDFVREVRPGLFHCGYCHLLVSEWDNICNHLKCSDHKKRKTRAQISMNRHLRNMVTDVFLWKYMMMMMGNNPLI